MFTSRLKRAMQRGRNLCGRNWKKSHSSGTVGQFAKHWKALGVTGQKPWKDLEEKAKAAGNAALAAARDSQRGGEGGVRRRGQQADVVDGLGRGGATEQLGRRDATAWDEVGRLDSKEEGGRRRGQQGKCVVNIQNVRGLTRHHGRITNHQSASVRFPATSTRCRIAIPTRRVVDGAAPGGAPGMVEYRGNAAVVKNKTPLFLPDIPRNTAKILMAGAGISWILIIFQKSKISQDIPTYPKTGLSLGFNPSEKPVLAYPGKSCDILKTAKFFLPGRGSLLFTRKLILANPSWHILGNLAIY
ncbi:hypothetical protein B0H13DRAFT_1857425 [Mycena leptocephala]|nr:hypothetical protein B0H13DRAFT_1857425 [Mycena leptocephala]